MGHSEPSAAGTLERWHRIVESGSPAGLEDILSANCVFLSPVVYSPQRGKALTILYLSGAMQVLNNGFRYTRGVVDGSNAVLEFACDIDGTEINGVDIITFDDDGLICEFKVMLRPLRAINLVHARMGEMLATIGAQNGAGPLQTGGEPGT